MTSAASTFTTSEGAALTRSRSRLTRRMPAKCNVCSCSRPTAGPAAPSPKSGFAKYGRLSYPVPASALLL